MLLIDKAPAPQPLHRSTGYGFATRARRRRREPFKWCVACSRLLHYCPDSMPGNAAGPLLARIVRLLGRPGNPRCAPPTRPRLRRVRSVMLAGVMSTSITLLLVECADRPGLVHAITGVLLRHGCNVISNHEFVDREHSRFFMRTEFTGQVERNAI